MNSSLVEVADVAPATIAVTLIVVSAVVADDIAGATAVQLVVEVQLTLVAVVVPKSNTVDPETAEKLDPVIVTVVPPAKGP